MIDQKLLKQIKKIQVVAKNLVANDLAGDYKASMKGQGLDFEEVREYSPGDDVRRIDWNVTARMHQPFIKVFREQKELTFYILLDVSRSTLFGSGDSSRKDRAAEFAAMIAYLAAFNNDRSGLVLFSDKVHAHLPPSTGRGHVWKLINTILDYSGDTAKETRISEALDFLAKIQKKPAMVFVLSDFIVGNYESTLKISAQKFDVIGIGFQDDRDKIMPKVGIIQLEHPESGEKYVIDTSDKNFRNLYADQFNKNSKAVIKKFKRCGADFYWNAPQESSVLTLKKALAGRGRRR